MLFTVSRDERGSLEHVHQLLRMAHSRTAEVMNSNSSDNMNSNSSDNMNSRSNRNNRNDRNDSSIIPGIQRFHGPMSEKIPVHGAVHGANQA